MGNFYEKAKDAVVPGMSKYDAAPEAKSPTTTENLESRVEQPSALPQAPTESMATGPAPHTAGPHHHDIANKLDPRVDSNQNGSHTLGGSKKQQKKDPRDAAQVPPSAMRGHVSHDITPDRQRRHSIPTHQELYRGV